MARNHQPLDEPQFCPVFAGFSYLLRLKVGIPFATYCLSVDEVFANSVVLSAGAYSLAMAEISLILAVLFRPNGPKLELFETDETDVRVAHDFGVPLPKLDTKGVRALVR